MCFGGGGKAPAPVYQSPAPAPAPVSATAVELKEEDDLVSDNGKNKKTGRDALRIDKSNSLGVAPTNTGASGVNLLRK